MHNAIEMQVTLSARAAIGIYFSIVRNDEVCEVPWILVGFDFDLLLLLVYRQSACWQNRTRTLAIGREDQLDRADAMIPGARSVVQLSEGKIAIGDETQSARALLRGQFHDVLDIIAYAPTGESDPTLGLQVLENIDQAILTLGLESLYEELTLFGRGILLDVDVDLVQPTHLRARPHRRCLNRHGFRCLGAR